MIDPKTFLITPKGETIWQTARAAPTDRVPYEFDEDHTRYGAFFVWPVSSMQCYPGRVLNTFRWVPLAVDRTLLIREWWFDRDRSDRRTAERSSSWTGPPPSPEDFDLMDSVQRGVSSRGYRPGPAHRRAPMREPPTVHHRGHAVPHLQALLLRALALGESMTARHPAQLAEFLVGPVGSGRGSPARRIATDCRARHGRLPSCLRFADQPWTRAAHRRMPLATGGDRPVLDHRLDLGNHAGADRPRP